MVGDGKNLRLKIVVSQHQSRNFIRHQGQQLIALLLGHLPIAHHQAQQYLDVHLMIRRVHTRRVVDGVGVDAHARQRRLNSAPLSQAQITTLDHHLAAQLGPVDAQPIVGAVAHIRVTLQAGLDIGANAAVVQQIHRGLEDGRDQISRVDAGLLQAQCTAGLGRQHNRLLGSRPNATAIRNQCAVVIGPAGTGQQKKPLTLLE